LPGDFTADFIFGDGAVCCANSSVNSPNFFNDGLMTLWGNSDPILGLDLRIGLSPVPVPAVVWLFGSGLLGLIGVARRRKV
jgi:hypothetical protein